MDKKMFFMFFILALTSFFVIRANLENLNDETSHEFYVYKYVNPEYYDFVAGIIFDDDNTSVFKEFDINFYELKLSDGYILNEGDYNRRTIINSWGLSDILKSDLNVTMGYPNCNEFLSKKFPSCFGSNADIRRGVNQVCDEIRDREKNPRTTSCNIFDQDPKLLTKDVFSEFYICNEIPEDLLYDDKNEMFLIMDDLLNSGSLFNYCKKII